MYAEWMRTRVTNRNDDVHTPLAGIVGTVENFFVFLVLTSTAGT